MSKTKQAKVLWNKLETDPNFTQKYYRVTNTSICPYIENAVYTEYQFLNDPNFDIWNELKYVEITKQEFESDYKKTLELEDQAVKNYYLEKCA